MPKKSKSINKSQQWSTWVLVAATVVLSISTGAYAYFAAVTGKDIKTAGETIDTALEYYASERTVSIFWKQYEYARDRIMPYITSSEEELILKNDLDTVFDELRIAEDELHYHRYLPPENYISVGTALDKFGSDYNSYLEK